MGLDAQNDGENVYLNLIGYVEGLFTSELQAVIVDTPNNWLTLCNSLNPTLSKAILGPNSTISETVCGFAGVSAPTTPHVGSDKIPADAAVIIHTAAAELLGWQIFAFFQLVNPITSPLFHIT